MSERRKARVYNVLNEYEKTDSFCPMCGKQEIWTDTGPGDYYMGNEFVCLGCDATFSLPGGGSSPELAEQIRTGEVAPEKPQGPVDLNLVYGPVAHFFDKQLLARAKPELLNSLMSGRIKGRRGVVKFKRVEQPK